MLCLLASRRLGQGCHTGRHTYRQRKQRLLGTRRAQRAGSPLPLSQAVHWEEHATLSLREQAAHNSLKTDEVTIDSDGCALLANCACRLGVGVSSSV